MVEETELGKTYVRIIPSAKEISAKIGEGSEMHRRRRERLMARVWEAALLVNLKQ